MLSSSVLRLVSSVPPTNALSTTTHSSQAPPKSMLRFRSTYRDNFRYLQSLGLINGETKFHGKNPSPESLTRILSMVSYLRTKGFSDSDMRRLSTLAPRAFSPEICPEDLEQVFDFLSKDLAASAEESCGLIVRCPEILESNVQFCLKPTLLYLRELGVMNLNSPTNLNAHLLNTRVNKLEEKVGFLLSIGFSHEESAKACARLPAIFGYSIQHNLWPKFDYLSGEMERSLDELKAFPQYFAFSLKSRIMPRHIHLMRKNVKFVPLKRMLMWSDQRFYARWK